MINGVYIEVKDKDGIYINGEKAVNVDDLKQQATEIKNNPLFEMLTEDAQMRALKDGFFMSKSWETTLGSKGWYACAKNMEKIVQQIIDFREPMI